MCPHLANLERDLVAAKNFLYALVRVSRIYYTLNATFVTDERACMHVWDARRRLHVFAFEQPGGTRA